MSEYDFDTPVDRHNSNSYKWDNGDAPEVLQMWVADMDFRTAPCIIKALRRRVDHGIFGYTHVPDEYYAALSDWFALRHDWTIDRSHVIYTSGVVPALSAIIKGLTKAGDEVIVSTPAYNCFFSSIRNNGCRLSDNELIYSVDGSYSIDFADLERRAASARLMILCNPHNPAGRVWTREELTRIADICRRHDVTVVADEIHCELTYPGYDYTPFALVAEAVGTRYVITNSPSKAFNTAGLQIANIICPDAEMRRRIDRAINDNEVCDVNPFGVVGLIAAYTQGTPWLDELRKYLWDNYVLCRDRFATEMPELTVTPLEGTYLAWVNIEATGLDAEQVCRALIEQAHVRFSPGDIYGRGGENFVRINLACPRAVVSEAINRITPVMRSLIVK